MIIKHNKVKLTHLIIGSIIIALCTNFLKNYEMGSLMKKLINSKILSNFNKHEKSLNYSSAPKEQIVWSDVVNQE